MSDDFNIKITGNWDFDNKKEIPEDETTKKAIDGLKDAFGNSETGKTLANMFKDGKINNKEAELVMMEFEDEGILGLDDFTVEGKEIEKFLSITTKSLSFKVGAILSPFTLTIKAFSGAIPLECRKDKGIGKDNI